MKLLNILIILLIILVMPISVVAASTEIPNFKYPDTFKKISDSEGYVNDMAQGMIVYKYDNSSESLFLTNHGQYGVEYYENNYYVFADCENNLGGNLEVVAYKGNKYIVISTISLDNLESQSGYIQENLEEFNKLNNVKPLTV